MIKTIGDSTITISAHNVDNGEVIAIMAHRKKAPKAIAKAVLMRKDFMEAQEVNYYSNGDFVDQEVMDQIAHLIRTLERR